MTAPPAPPAGPSGRARGMVAINVTAVIFGTAALFGKLPVSPLWIVGVRSVVATLTLLAWGSCTGELRPVPRAQWPAVAGSALVMTASWLLFYSTVQLGSVAIATLTFATFPLFALLIESWHLRRRPRPIELAATLAIFGAVYLVVGPASTALAQWAVFAGLGSALLYALYFSILPAETAWRALFITGFAPALLVFYIRGYVEEPSIYQETKKALAAAGHTIADRANCSRDNSSFAGPAIHRIASRPAPLAGQPHGP